MKNINLKSLLSSCLLASLVTACGSSSDNNNIGTSSTSMVPNKLFGTVSAISHADNLLTISGYQVGTSNATVEYQDKHFPLSAISKGTRIEVETHNGNASEIDLNPAVSGMVTKVDQDTFEVNGNTFTSPDSTQSIKVGTWVLVSANQLVDGQWKVSSVDETTMSLYAETEGRVSALNHNTSTFKINGVTIGYSNAEIDDAPLKNGQWVEVLGQFNGGKIEAVEVDVEQNSLFDDADIQGVITWVNSEKNLLELDNKLRISVASTTEFEDGTRQQLQVGALVNIEVITINNQLVAKEIDFESRTISPKQQQFSVEGFATVSGNDILINGIAFTTNSATYFDDRLSLAAINNKWVELEGISLQTNGSTQWLVKEVESDMKDIDISLEGQVSSNSLWGYQSSDNSLAQFNGKWVDVECRLNGNDLLNCRLDR